jgi:flavorubredoxin
MTVTNSESGTRIDEVARGIYRISTPERKSPAMPPGFSFNQILIAAEQPLLFHAGPRRMFGLVREAVSKVLAPESLRFIGFSHCEADESGALAEWLDLAPQAQALCSRVGAMIFANDVRPRPVKAMAHAERLDLGGHEVTWFDAPHVPHGWDCGFLGELSTRTLLCGDLFTQPGDENPPLTTRDVLGPSEGMRQMFDYYSHGPNTGSVLEQLAGFEPRLLACMHGSCFEGDGRAALLELKQALTAAR